MDVRLLRSGSLFVFVVALKLTFSSCARTTTSLANLSPNQRARVIEMKVYKKGELQGAKVRYRGNVEGLSCKTSMLYDPPTESEAIRDVKMQAASRGANALTNLVCESTGFSWYYNCSDSITCYAEALSVSGIRPAKKIPIRDDPPAISTSPSPNIHNASVGTGWMVAQGFVITNWDVVEGHDKITLSFQYGQRVGAKVVTKDVQNDVALLSLEKEEYDRPAIPLAKDIPKMGQSVFTIGFPAPELMGKQPKLTSGTIASLTGIEDDPRFIQMSVPIQPGNSGGPLLNSKGEAVGMVTAKLNPSYTLTSEGFLPENVGYAIKIDYLIPLLHSAPPSITAAELVSESADLSDLAMRIGPAIVQVVAE